MEALQKSLSELSKQLEASNNLGYKLIRYLCKTLIENNLIGKKIAIKRGEFMNIIDVYAIKPTYGFVRFEGYCDIFHYDGRYEVSDLRPKKYQWIHIPIEDVFSIKVIDVDSEMGDVYSSIAKAKHAVSDFFKKIYG